MRAVVDERRLHLPGELYHQARADALDVCVDHPTRELGVAAYTSMSGGTWGRTAGKCREWSLPRPSPSLSGVWGRRAPLPLARQQWFWICRSSRAFRSTPDHRAAQQRQGQGPRGPSCSACQGRAHVLGDIDVLAPQRRQGAAPATPSWLAISVPWAGRLGTRAAPAPAARRRWGRRAGRLALFSAVEEVTAHKSRPPVYAMGRGQGRRADRRACQARGYPPFFLPPCRCAAVWRGLRRPTGRWRRWPRRSVECPPTRLCCGRKQRRASRPRRERSST